LSNHRDSCAENEQKRNLLQFLGRTFSEKLLKREIIPV